MLAMGTCYQSFKNMLIVKYILSFKDKPNLLKKPPVEYEFIHEEDWNIFVKNHFFYVYFLIF